MTVRFKNELVRNITIKLGYANAKVRRSIHRLPADWLLISISLRSTNVKMKHVQDQDATGPTAQTRRIAHHANALDVGTE